MSNPVTYNFALDVQKPTSNVFCSVQAGDTASKLVVSLNENSEPIELTDDTTAVLCGLKSDGKLLYNACTVDTDNNTVNYDFTAQTANTVGLVYCQIKLASGGTVKSSPLFRMDVQDNVYDEQRVVSTSESEFNLLTGYIDLIATALENGRFKGDKGEQGEPGPTGPQGNKGDKGDPGITVITSETVPESASWGDMIPTTYAGELYDVVEWKNKLWVLSSISDNTYTWEPTVKVMDTATYSTGDFISLDEATENDVIYRVVGSTNARHKGFMIFCGNKNTSYERVSQIRFEKADNAGGERLMYRSGTVNVVEEGGQTVKRLVWDGEGAWNGIALNEIEKATNKVTSISTSDPSDEKYPSEKAVRTELNSLGTLVYYKAKEGNVDEEQLDTATDNGVLYHVDGKTPSNKGWLVFSGTTSRKDCYSAQYFFTREGNIKYRHGTTQEYVTTWGSWIDFENASNKVTSLSPNSTDDEYPSAKCVYDMIGDIESLLAQI